MTPRGAQFAGACRTVLDHDRAARDRRARPLQTRQEWDVIAASMAGLLDDPDADAGRADEAEPA
jgi:hypothetical protein